MAMSSKFKPRKIGLAAEFKRGAGIFIPGTGSGTSAGGGEYGAQITDDARTFAITRRISPFATSLRRLVLIGDHCYFMISLLSIQTHGPYKQESCTICQGSVFMIFIEISTC